MELLGGWDRVRRNLVGTFFLQANTALLEEEIPQPPNIILLRQTYTVPITELEREYGKLAELDEELEKEREIYSQKKKEFGLRWQQCSEENDLLQEFISKFEEYFKASNSKQKADRQANAKLDQDIFEKRREARKLQKELNRMKELQVELEKRLKTSIAYKDFLQSVVKESQGEFENIEQVIARYYELKDIREDFVKKIVKQVEDAFTLQMELRDIVQESKLEETAGKAYLSELEQYRNRLQVSNWRRHDNLLALKDGLKRQLLTSHYPKTAIYNLYILLCQEMGQPVEIGENEFQQQLQFILKFLKELEKVSKRTKQFFECPSDVPLVSEKGEKGRRQGNARQKQTQ